MLLELLCDFIAISSINFSSSLTFLLMFPSTLLHILRGPNTTIVLGLLIRLVCDFLRMRYSLSSPLDLSGRRAAIAKQHLFSLLVSCGRQHGALLLEKESSR